MGSVYYQQDNNLDSLSNVRGFSSALNGKTYGFKKRGGIFSPEEIGGSGGEVSGVIPNGGLYLDGVNRVGVLLNANSALQSDSNGLSVDCDINGGLEVSVDGLKIKDTNSIDSSGPNVKVGNGLEVTTNGVDVKIGDASLTIDPANGLEVYVASASSVGKDSAGFLNVKTGAGLERNLTSGIISVNYDNTTITLNGSGQLQASGSSVPTLSSYLTYILQQGQVYTNSPTTLNADSGVELNIPCPNNYGLIIYLRFSNDFNSGNVALTGIRQIIIGYSGDGLTIPDPNQPVAFVNSVYNYGGDPVQYHLITKVFTTNIISNTSGSASTCQLSIRLDNAIGGTSLLKILEGTVQVYLFPISP